MVRPTHVRASTPEPRTGLRCRSHLPARRRHRARGPRARRLPRRHRRTTRPREVRASPATRSLRRGLDTMTSSRSRTPRIGVSAQTPKAGDREVRPGSTNPAASRNRRCAFRHGLQRQRNASRGRSRCTPGDVVIVVGAGRNNTRELVKTFPATAPREYGERTATSALNGSVPRRSWD